MIQRQKEISMIFSSQYQCFFRRFYHLYHYHFERRKHRKITKKTFTFRNWEGGRIDDLTHLPHPPKSLTSPTEITYPTKITYTRYNSYEKFVVKSMIQRQREISTMFSAQYQCFFDVFHHLNQYHFERKKTP